MSNKKYMALLLEGPMQSWGIESRFNRRTTEIFPSKSGILGLLAAAMGIDKYAENESAEIRKLAALHCQVFALHRREIQRIVDYHTVGGGYDKKDKLHKLRHAESGSPSKDAALTYRHYLLDACFGAILSGETALLDKSALALQNPKWGLWLGRKCCIPSNPIFVALEEDKEVAWKKLLIKARYDENRAEDSFQYLEDVSDGEERLSDETRSDLPIAYGAPIGQRHTRRIVRKHIPSELILNNKGT